MIKHSKGSILVNDKMETSSPASTLWADCVKGYSQLAHTASAKGEMAAENALGGSGCARRVLLSHLRLYGAGGCLCRPY